MNLSRRGFIGGLAALVAAPAIVRVENLMVLPAPTKILLPEGLVAFNPVETAAAYAVRNNLLTIDMITREAVRLFQNSNAFIKAIDRQYEEQFAVQGARIGSQLKIKLPVHQVWRPNRSYA